MTESAETQSPPPPVVADVEPEEIAPGVYVIPDGRVPLVPNVGIVVGEREALVVDTGMGPRNGRRVLREDARADGQAARPHDHALPPRARLRRAGVRGRGADRLQPGAEGGAGRQGRGVPGDVPDVRGRRRRAAGRRRARRAGRGVRRSTRRSTSAASTVELHAVRARAHARRPGRLPARSSVSSSPATSSRRASSRSSPGSRPTTRT